MGSAGVLSVRRRLCAPPDAWWIGPECVLCAVGCFDFSVIFHSIPRRKRIFLLLLRKHIKSTLIRHVSSSNYDNNPTFYTYSGDSCTSKVSLYSIKLFYNRNSILCVCSSGHLTSVLLIPSSQLCIPGAVSPLCCCGRLHNTPCVLLDGQLLYTCADGCGLNVLAGFCGC